MRPRELEPSGDPIIEWHRQQQLRIKIAKLDRALAEARPVTRRSRKPYYHRSPVGD